MKSKELKIIGILVVIAIILIIVLVRKNEVNKEELQKQIIASEDVDEEYVMTLLDGSKINASSKLSQKKKIDNIEIENISITYKNNKSTFIAEIKNVSNTLTDKMLVTIELYDKQGDLVEKLEGIIPKLNIGETAKLNISATKDITSAYDYKIVMK